MAAALTNFDPKDGRAEIYEQAAKNTGFPCWVEKHPMPIGSHLWDDGRLQGYDPAECTHLWSLWTEWGNRDHSKFWREVERLSGESGAI